MRPWENDALLHGLLGEWHEKQVVPKWFDGARWHDEHLELEVCVNDQFRPVLRWHVWHEPDLCPPGRGWHEAQLADEPGCENDQLLPTLRWQVTHDPDLCPLGRGWHEAHPADEAGCRNDQESPAEWHVVHDPERCFAGAVWHDVHAVLAGCENAQLAPGAATWHCVHSPFQVCLAVLGS